MHMYRTQKHAVADVILESEHHFAQPIHFSRALEVSTMKGFMLLYVGVWNTLHEDIHAFFLKQKITLITAY